MSNPNRRTVSGTAYKECEFCGRNHTDKHEKPYNYQYLNEKTQDWDKHIFCSKVCYSAWQTVNWK